MRLDADRAGAGLTGNEVQTMTLKVNYKAALSANESISGVGVKAQDLAHTLLDVAKTFSAASSPPVDAISEQTLSSASGTIDLTALPATLGGTQSASGKKLVLLQIINRGTHVFSIQAGASSGYAIGGVAIKVQPGGDALINFADALTDVDGTHKNLDYTFFAADQADIRMVFG
jgi:hypothetical protein